MRNADESGQSSFKEMSDEKVSLCEEIRDSRKATREITVNCFGEDLLSFPTNEIQEVVKRFEENILKDFINDIKQHGN